MIQVTDNIWIGGSVDEFNCEHMTAILNVAIDLRRTNPKTPYAQCPLIDGPGNNLNAYRAAVFQLMSFLEDGRRVLVCCHDGGRSLAVVLIFLHQATDTSHSELLKILQERTDVDLPKVHEAHRQAFKELA